MRTGRHREPYTLTKVCLWLDVESWQWLRTRHRHDASRIVRELVVDYYRRSEERRQPRAAEELAALARDFDRL